MPYTLFRRFDDIDKNGKKQTPSIKDFTSISTEVNVDFTIVFPKGKLDDLLMLKMIGILMGWKSC